MNISFGQIVLIGFALLMSYIISDTAISIKERRKYIKNLDRLEDRVRELENTLSGIEDVATSKTINCEKGMFIIATSAHVALNPK
jgi:hypothetical protein